MSKLLYIANLRLPTEKAHGIQITKMCEAFASQDVKVILVYPFRKNQEKGDIFSYYSLKKNFRAREIWAPDFYLHGRFDRIAVNIKGVISALLLCFYAISQKADIIYSRDEWPLYFLSFFKNNLFFEAHRFSKSRLLFYERFRNKNLKIIAITERLKKDFIKIGFGPENITVAPDGVDLAEFDVEISKEEARIVIGLPLDKNIIMYSGHLFEWKGANVLLEVARNFQFPIINFQNTKEVLFVFVGGTLVDIEKFKKAASDLNNVRIIGHKPHGEIPIFLKAADVLVLPNSAKEEISRSYTSPLKLFEYMASGRPIVASNLPSLKEILNENNSVLVEPDSAESLSEGIRKILENNVLANQIGVQGFEDVQKYTWQARAQKILTYIGF